MFLGIAFAICICNVFLHQLLTKSQNKKSEQAKACSDVVAELGFEPRQTESESAVLPLHNSAIYYIGNPQRLPV